MSMTPAADGLAAARGFVTRGVRALVLGALCPTFVLAVTPAGAQATANAITSTATVRLAWARRSGAGSCPDERWARKELMRRLGRDPFDERASRSLEVVLAQSSGKFEADISLWRGEGQPTSRRYLVSDEATCRTLAEAVVLAVALTIDPARKPQGPKPPQRLAKPAIRMAPARDDTPESLDARAGWAAAASLGLLPRPAFGFSLSLGSRAWRRWRWETGFLFLPEVRGDDNSEFGLGLVAGRASGCYAFTRSRAWRLDACARLYGGELRPVVYRLQPRRSEHQLWIAASAVLATELQLIGRLALQGALEAVFPVTRDRFFVEGSSAFDFRQAPVGANLCLGLGLRLD